MTGWKEKLALTAQRNRQEIVKAKLSRREMMRLGLLTGGGGLIVKEGLSARAFADDGTLTFVKGVDGPPSPPATPWVQPMPTLTIKTPLDPFDPNQMPYGPPDGTTLIDGPRNGCRISFSPTTPKPKPMAASFRRRSSISSTCKRLGVKVHPSYEPTTVWGFDGQVPGPLIQARYGEPIWSGSRITCRRSRHRRDFGIAEMTTHLHNGHTPTESDGNPVDFFNSVNDTGPLTRSEDGQAGQGRVGNVIPVNPHGFKDQHYPNVYAGFSARSNTIGDPTEAMGSLWYHDHHLDYTAQNVYKGMFGCYNLFDDQDTGDETTGLRLPSGKYDVPIFFNDALFDQDYQLVFDLFDLDGILGDKYLANGAIQPYLDVEKRRYRFRLYNPGPSRWWEFALYDGKNFLPFWQISTDGNLLPNAVKVSSVRLAVAERADIVVDFSTISAQRLYIVNRLEQVNGRGPTGKLLSPA